MHNTSVRFMGVRDKFVCNAGKIHYHLVYHLIKLIQKYVQFGVLCFSVLFVH